MQLEKISKAEAVQFEEDMQGIRYHWGEFKKSEEYHGREIGKRLLHIRDARLYRHQYQTFELFIAREATFSKTYAYRLIGWANIGSKETSLPIGDGPKTESQARPLTKLSQEKQPAAWERAQEIAEEQGEEVRARHVEAAVEEFQEEEPKHGNLKRIHSRPEDGMMYAEMAIEQLKKIDLRDKERGKAFAYVLNWINKNKL